jgi:hypothetical protein
MELKLNFKLGQKTINGRTYNIGDLQGEFDRLLKEQEHIQIGPDNDNINKQDGTVPDEVLVGVAKSYRIEQDGTVLFDVQEMSDQTEEWLKNNPDVMKLTLFGFGNIDSEQVVHDFKLGCLFMTQDEG